eukprot:5294079-Alexandrium_andersonii.AAC.1
MFCTDSESVDEESLGHTGSPSRVVQGVNGQSPLGKASEARNPLGTPQNPLGGRWRHRKALPAHQ